MERLKSKGDLKRDRSGMPSATLSVSSSRISHCYSIVQAMKDLKICGDVTENTSVTPDGELEVGCRILIPGPNSFQDSKNLWERLKGNSFTCGFLDMKDNRSGCVYDIECLSVHPA